MTRLSALAALAVLAGCATQPPVAVAPAPECSTPKQCEVMWSAARAWIVRHAGYRIARDSDSMIETFPSVAGATALAARVLREALPDGRYRIEGKVWCDNWIGCDRPPAVALNELIAAVRIAGESVRPAQ